MSNGTIPVEEQYCTVYDDLYLLWNELPVYLMDDVIIFWRELLIHCF